MNNTIKKLRKEFKWLKPSECDFIFYIKNGSFGMYSCQTRHYWFCIPFVLGIRYTVSWGSNL